MPVRNIRLCYGSVSGRVPMGPGKPLVRVESTLERDFALLQKFGPAVLSLEEQPVRITFRSSEGKARSYVPDFLVHYRDGAQPSRLVEIKYADDPQLVSGALNERFAAAQRYARCQGWSFEVVTDTDIRTPFLANATFLLPYRSRTIASQITGTLLATLRRSGPLSVRSLMAATDIPPAVALTAVWACIATFQIQADLSQPLTMNSVIHLPQEDVP